MLLLTLLLACPASEDTAKGDSTSGTETGAGDDRDGDGVPDDADCLPDNANAYPGHYEVPYNGVDDDCDGSDTTDVDADGFDGTGGGGGDCDDSNPEINPGEIEHCYDGLDNNCDDWEGGNDCDGDGYDISHDCWDDESIDYPNGGGLVPKDVHPEAEDVWYDGTDADCGGNDDYDQDADGASTEASGGTDCLDTDPLVNPDMDEVWNDLDDDCDGDIDTMVPNRASMKVSGDTGRGELGFATALLFLPDLDGDGRDDLVVGASGTSDSNGWVWVLPTPDGIVTPSLEALGYLSGTAGAGASLALTEVTGDTRVAVGSPWGETTGAVDFYDPSAIGDGKGDARIEYTDAGGSLSTLHEGGLYSGCVYWGVVAATMWTNVSGTVTMDDAPFAIYSEDHYCADSGTFGDLDGDGLDEVFVSTLAEDLVSAELYLAPSTLSGAGGVVAPEDLDDLGGYTYGYRFGTLPDLTGDGYDEAVITNSAQDALSTGDGRAWIVNGDAFTGSWTTDAFVTVSGGTSGASLRLGTRGDLDGDGADDLLVGLPGLGSVEFVAVSDVLLGGDLVPTEQSPSFHDTVGADLFGESSWAHDVDHNGTDDLLVRTDRNAGALQLYLHL